MKSESKSLWFKLWTYFTIFAIVILAVLWLLQTVFLEGFYDVMQKNHIKKIADEICGAGENADSVIDSVAAENPILVFLTDADGNILYSADEYSFSYRKREYSYADHGGDKNPYRAEYYAQAYRHLPEHYDDFLSRLADADSVCYTIDHDNEGSTLIYGQRLTDGSILYINTPIGAIGSAVSIIRLQLCAVTVLALIVGFLIAIFISKKFSKPIFQLSEQSLRMAEGDFDISFKHGFCAETDRLADSMAYAADKIAETDRLRRELLANVSHDLRTPLTMIKGYAELICDMDGEEGAGDDAKIIIREADRLSALVNDILYYSKFRSGEVRSEPEKTDIGSLAETTAEQFSAICKAKNISITQAIEPKKYVMADKKRIQQVLYNLISNAIAHTKNNGSINISAAEKDNFVRIEIRDSGSGIFPQDLPHIWDRYFTSENGGTNGLGLAIVKEILTAHNAPFGVDSKPGQGSTFWFELKKTPV